MPASTSAPRVLPRADIKVGFACNNRCVFCAQGSKRSDCGAIPVETLIEGLTGAHAGSRGLVLTGGKPALHRRILALVSAARRLGYRPIQIQTNGRMLSCPKVLQSLREAGATEFSPSLLGSTAALRDALTRVKGRWKQSVEGIAAVTPPARESAAFALRSPGWCLPSHRPLPPGMGVTGATRGPV